MSVINIHAARNPTSKTLRASRKTEAPLVENHLTESYQQGLAIIRALQETLDSAYKSGNAVSLAVVTSQSPGNTNRNVWFSNAKTLEERLGLLEMGKMLMYLEL